MDKTAVDSISWTQAPAEHFTGDVWFGEMAPPDKPDDLNVLGVQFAPGSRTDWHSHPGGQVLYVVSGSGLVANKDGERVAIASGDTVATPPNELHWHGATPDSPMLHLSITHHGATEWTEEKVSDLQYGDQA
jgi:quercetin dioxygenase-like cupin family protein